jgi:hypothetical protein
VVWAEGGFADGQGPLVLLLCAIEVAERQQHPAKSIMPVGDFRVVRAKSREGSRQGSLGERPGLLVLPPSS